MKVLRFHAALLPTEYGCVAVLLDDPAYTAHAPDQEGAERALVQLLQKALKEDPWMSPGECDEFQVLIVPVDLRPEYRACSSTSKANVAYANWWAITSRRNSRV